MEDQWRRASMGTRVLERSEEGAVIHRVPTYVVQLVGANQVGWFGWDPLNMRWVSAPYGLPFAYQKNLHEALEFIDWAQSPRERFTIDWLSAYPHASSYGCLTLQQRRHLAHLLESGVPLTRPFIPHR
jgi:hypothetical protein